MEGHAAWPVTSWEVDIDVNPDHESRFEFVCSCCGKKSIKFALLYPRMIFKCKCGTDCVLRDQECKQYQRNK